MLIFAHVDENEISDVVCEVLVSGRLMRQIAGT